MFTAKINCGHGVQADGTWDPGAVYKNLEEAGIMFPITKAFVKYARLSGITVYSDVDSDNGENILTGVADANAKDVDVFISIHGDWEKAPSGTMPLHHKDSKDGKRLAECLNEHVEEYTGIPTRDIVGRDDLYELNATKMPACVFECGSITADRYEWDTEKECDEYGKALAKGLCKYFGIPFKSKTDDITVDGLWGPATTKATQKLFDLKQTGTITGQLNSCKKYLPNAETSSWKFKKLGFGCTTIKRLQKLVGVKADGKAGVNTVKALQSFLKEKGYNVGTIDGIMGEKTVKAWQKYLNKNL